MALTSEHSDKLWYHQRVDPKQKEMNFGAHGNPDELKRLCSAADSAMGMSPGSGARAATVKPKSKSIAKWDNPPHQGTTEAMDVNNCGQSSAVKQDRKLGL